MKEKATFYFNFVTSRSMICFYYLFGGVASYDLKTIVLERFQNYTLYIQIYFHLVCQDASSACVTCKLLTVQHCTGSTDICMASLRRGGSCVVAGRCDHLHCSRSLYTCRAYHLIE